MFIFKLDHKTKKNLISSINV